MSGFIWTNIFDDIETNTMEYTDSTTYQSETSNSSEDEITTIIASSSITTTISATTMERINSTLTTMTTTPKGLTGGAIAGIVIGIIVGIILLIFVSYIIYKYRKRCVDMIRKSPSQSNDRSVHYKPETLRTNINFAPPGEYLTVDTLSSRPNQPSRGKFTKQNNR